MSPEGIDPQESVYGDVYRPKSKKHHPAPPTKRKGDVMAGMKLIYLEWEDSRSDDGWRDAKETEEFFAKSTLVKQVGWVYSEDDRNICLVGRVGAYMWTGIDDAAYGHIQKIPKTWVINRTDLTEHLPVFNKES